MNRESGYRTVVERRSFLTNHVEYLVRVGDRVLKIQPPHRNEFSQDETCYLRFPGVMWYPADEDVSGAERNRRQLV